jgi:hypothetical protein
MSKLGGEEGQDRYEVVNIPIHPLTSDAIKLFSGRTGEKV